MTTRATTSVAASTTARPSPTPRNARRGRLHRRRRELGRAGGDVHVALGEVGDATRARAVAGGVDVLLPDPADREERQDHGPHLHRSGRHARRGRPPHRPCAVRTSAPARGRPWTCRPAVLLHRRRAAHRLAGRGGARTTTDSSCPAPTSRTSAAGRWTVRRTTWKQVCPVCLLQVMCVPSPPNGWPPPSAKGRWR